MMVEGEAALSVAEDLLVLSSAKFTPGAIDVDDRIGVDLLLPLARALPFERHVRWSARKQIPGKVAQQILVKSTSIVSALAMLGPVAKVVSKRSAKLPGPLGKALAVANGLLAGGSLEKVADLVGEKLEQTNADAKAKNHRMTTILTGLLLALERAQEQQVLKRSNRWA